ncbi:MFS transporter [Kiloniella antarctica]|uniref:MFS transporter n=1 Tax=Kiloniella antarctica TaxID=1550907 RepID=A0ABW5BQS3_9PROT
MINRLGIPYSLFYIFVFMTMGIILVFWPIWLETKGLSKSEIGWILSLPPFLMIFISPSIAYFSEKSGRSRTVLSITSLISASFFLCFYISDGFYSYLALQAGASCCFLSLIPLGDSQTLKAVRLYDLSYGRIRLWGSLSFIATSFGAGYLLDLMGIDWTLWLIICALLVVAAFSFSLPLLPNEQSQTSGNPRIFLKKPSFLLFILGAGMIIGSHAAYYAFGSLYMISLGYSKTLIGFIWAFGVMAEVILFAFSNKIFKSARSLHLILIGSIAGIIRWGTLGFDDSMVVIIGIQLLHALTFGATHLGSMSFISRHAPKDVTASAQSLYSSIANGLMMGIAILISGRLYDIDPSYAFFGMTLLAATGGLIILTLSRFVPPSKAPPAEKYTHQELP